MVVTWQGSDCWLRAAAAADVRAGRPPRSVLVLFDGGVSTLVGLGPPVAEIDPLSQVLDLATFANAVGARAVALSMALLPPEERGGELTAALVAAPTQLLTVRARRRGRRVSRRGRLTTVRRGDRGEVGWARPRWIPVRAFRSVSRLLRIATGREPVLRDRDVPPVVAAAYLRERGYELIAARGGGDHLPLGGER